MLTPDYTYRINGVTIKSKIIPDGTRWKDAAKAQRAGFSPNSLYKKQARLRGKNIFVTIHNTDDIPRVDDDGEQYARATYNENMGSARVHMYIDDLGGWQTLKAGTGMTPDDPTGAAEVGWHAGDGSVSDGGNMTSLGLEIIMNDNAAHDAKAYDNGARVAAWLLHKHKQPLSRLVTHTYWVNKAAGRKSTDVDEQCATVVPGKKWCPTYIFKSYDSARAVANWKSLKNTVGRYLDALTGTPTQTTDKPPDEKPENTDEPSEWAKAATEWAKENGIFIGDENGSFRWHDPITREESAKALQNAFRAAGLLIEPE